MDCVIIYMRSRIFRNYIEAAVVKQQLDKLGVKLVSAKENFGEGYMTEAMEAVTDVFNWGSITGCRDTQRHRMVMRLTHI